MSRPDVPDHIVELLSSHHDALPKVVRHCDHRRGRHRSVRVPSTIDHSEHLNPLEQVEQLEQLGQLLVAGHQREAQQLSGGGQTRACTQAHPVRVQHQVGDVALLGIPDASWGRLEEERTLPPMPGKTTINGMCETIRTPPSAAAAAATQSGPIRHVKDDKSWMNKAFDSSYGCLSTRGIEDHARGGAPAHATLFLAGWHAHSTLRTRWRLLRFTCSAGVPTALRATTATAVQGPHMPPGLSQRRKAQRQQTGTSTDT